MISLVQIVACLSVIWQPEKKKTVLTGINLHIAVLPFKIFLKKSLPVSGEDLM